MSEKQHTECQYFRLRHSEEKGIYYECTHWESEITFDDAICDKYTTEKDIFNMW